MPSRPARRPADPAAPATPIAAPTAARPRDRDATTERILAAVGEVLARDGFAAIGVNAIAKQAGVDKVLIYRYFGGLPELLRTWGSSGRFWPRLADLLAVDPGLAQRPAAERYRRFFEHFVAELRRRPLTIEILAAEVAHRNELTAILETEREQWGEEAARLIGGPEFAASPHAEALTILVVVAIQYLLVRARTVRHFGGLDVTSDEGWARILAGIGALADMLFVAPAGSAPAPAPAPASRSTAAPASAPAAGPARTTARRPRG